MIDRKMSRTDLDALRQARTRAEKAIGEALGDFLVELNDARIIGAGLVSVSLETRIEQAQVPYPERSAKTLYAVLLGTALKVTLTGYLGDDLKWEQTL